MDPGLRRDDGQVDPGLRRDDGVGAAAPSAPPPRTAGAAGRVFRRLFHFDAEHGFWPYVNLVYLVFAWVPLLFYPRITGAALAATTAATLLFLPLYFAGYRDNPRRFRALICAIAAIGLLLIPINVGGNTFLIYAVALAANALSARQTLAVMLVVLGLMAVEVAWLSMPWPFLGFTALICVVVSVASLYGRVEALRNAELRLGQEEVRRLARTAERERIGRDLHDLLGHTLSLVALKSELALKLLDRDPLAARVEMAEVERITRDALAQVRSAVTGIRAAGLEAELSAARLCLLSAGVQMEARLDPVELSEQVGTALALGLREAVTNIVRHAKASRVEVELRVQGRWVHLVIADDGRGALPVPGNGLSGMRERIEALGGELQVDATPGEGVRLALRVPRTHDDPTGAGGAGTLANAETSHGAEGAGGEDGADGAAMPAWRAARA